MLIHRSFASDILSDAIFAMWVTLPQLLGYACGRTRGQDQYCSARDLRALMSRGDLWFEGREDRELVGAAGPGIAGLVEMRAAANPARADGARCS